MIPVAGSAYAYTYATMGEFMAWMVGWILMLEYAIGNITVASAWSGYFMQFMKGFKAHLPAFILNIPLWLKYDYRTIYSMCEKYGWNIHDKIPYLFDKIPIAINMPAKNNRFNSYTFTYKRSKRIDKSRKHNGWGKYVYHIVIHCFWGFLC